MVPVAADFEVHDWHRHLREISASGTLETTSPLFVLDCQVFLTFSQPIALEQASRYRRKGR